MRGYSPAAIDPSGNGSQVCETRLFVQPFVIPDEKRRFAKTGSGQSQGKHFKKEWRCRW